MEPRLASQFRELCPPARHMATGVDPPALLPCFVLLLADRRQCVHHAPSRLPLAPIAPGSGQALLRTLLRDPREQGANFCLSVPAVTAERADGRQLSRLSPTGDGFRVHPEHCRDLCRCQQRLGFWCACRHVYGLSSWTGTAILRFVAVPGSVGEPAVDVPYGLLRDHIAITSRDKSTTGSKVSVLSYPVAPLI